MTTMLLIQRFVPGAKVETVYYGPEAGNGTGAAKSSTASARMKKAWQTRTAKAAGVQDAKK